MTDEEVKEAFRAYLPARQAMKTAHTMYKQLRSDIDGLTGISMDGLSRSTVPLKLVEQQVERLQKALLELSAETQRYADTIDLAFRLLALIDDADGKEIIRLRFFVGLKFDFIPARIHMERAAMFRHYRKAINEVKAKSEIDTQ